MSVEIVEVVLQFGIFIIALVGLCHAIFSKNNKK